MPSNTDSPLLVALQRGDPLAWRDVYRQQWRRAWAVAARYLRDPRDVEDTASLALQQLHTQIANIHNMDHLDAMVSVLSQRRAISLLREQTTRKRGDLATVSLSALDEATHPVPVATEHPLLPPEHGTPAEAATRKLDLEHFLASLPVADRELLYDYFGRGLSSQEIARRSGANPNTLRSRVLRLLQDLRTRLRSPDR